VNISQPKLRSEKFDDDDDDDNNNNSINHLLTRWFNNTGPIRNLAQNIQTYQKLIYRTYLQVRFTTGAEVCSA